MIKLACPNCTKQLAVEDSTAGSVCKCRACASKFRVPDAAKAERSATKSRPPEAKRPAGRDSDVSEVEPLPEGTPNSSRKARPPRDSIRSGSPPAGTAQNGITLDKLEVVSDEDDEPSRKPARKKARGRATPTWEYVTASVAGVLLCALVALAFFFKPVAIALIVIGLPASLFSRKSRLVGAVGVAYLLSGAGLFVLHNSLLRRLDGPPPDGATAQVIDSHCATLLKDSNKTEAGAWVGVEKPTDKSVIKGLRGYIQDAYNAGAPMVWLTNLDRKDEGGIPNPILIVVLPEDEGAKQRVLGWYRVVGRRRVPGEKYLYVDWD